MTKKILIVEDELAILFLLERVFEDLARWETLGASSGLEGLEKAFSENLDAIVLDLSLPEIDGFEFIKRLRANPLKENLPIVLLTAKFTPRDQNYLSQLSVSGVIAKPFDPMTVWQEVAQILGWNNKES